MKGVILTLVMLIGFLPIGNSQGVIFSYKQFQMPIEGVYVESYLSFIASSLKYKENKNNKLQSHLLVTQIIKQRDSIISFQKFEVKSPELIDKIALDFTDKKQFFLSPGTYNVEFEILDLNRKNAKSVFTNKIIEVENHTREINISGIELIDYYTKTGKEKNEFSKSGFDIYPLVSNYLPTEVDKLAYYYEIYNSKNTTKTCVLTQYIETYITQNILPNYIKRKRIDLKQINPIMNVFNISKLPSGNYNLVIELRDATNTIISTKKVFIQRVNNNFLDSKTLVAFNDSPIHLPKDSIDYFMESLLPIANRREYKILKYNKKKLSYKKKKNYFTNFWKSKNSKNPNGQWLAYYNIVKHVEQKFGNRIKHGFETDMGRVFLKYGKPNDIIEKLYEQGTYPYVIWHYYKTKNQSNVRFVFYHSTAISNDMELIHSNMNNEISNPNWKYLVNMRTNGSDSKADEDEERMR